MENTVSSNLHDEIRAIEFKFQSQLTPMQEVLNEVVKHNIRKNLLGTTMNLMGRIHLLQKRTPFLLGYSPLHPTLWGIHVTGLVVLSWI